MFICQNLKISRIHYSLSFALKCGVLGHASRKCKIYRSGLYKSLPVCCGWRYLHQNDGLLVGYFWRWLIQRSGWPPVGNVQCQQWGSEILMWWREAGLFSSRGLLPHISVTSMLFLRVCTHSHLNVWTPGDQPEARGYADYLWPYGI